MRSVCFLTLSMTIVFIIGCSSGVNTPNVPLTGDIEATATNLPVLSASLLSDGSFEATGLLGAYELRIDPINMGAELIADRQLSALGNSWIVSGVGFFTIAPCSTCLSIKSLALTAENYLQLTFAIRHPFKPGDISQPPTARNRLDLDIFDLKAIIKPDSMTPTNYPLLGTSIYSGVLANNAGYTTELANLVSDSSALPYALVIDKNANPSSPDWNKFAMGAESFFDIFFRLGSGSSMSFKMYITMGYGASAANRNQRLEPVYFNPEFNSKSAWKVMVTPPNGTNPPSISNTWNSLDSTTTWPVTVKVCDWQHGVTSINNPPVNPGDIAAASNVAMVQVEIPGMTNTIPMVTTPSSGTGSPSDPLVYLVQIANQRLLGAGEYIGLVKVVDSRIPPNPISGIDHLIDVPDGVQIFNYVIPEFATYQIFKATVVEGSVTNQPPVASAVPVTPTSIYDGQTVTFNASASHDPDGVIVSYEWDFNEDGIFAGVGDEYTGAPHNPTHVFRRGDGTISVQLRVTDNHNAQDTLNSPINITVKQSKNVILRDGYEIQEITAVEDRDMLLVLFNDKQVWKYDLLLTSGGQFSKFDDRGWPHNDPWQGRIQANNEGFYIVVGFPYHGIGSIMRSYDPDGNEHSDLWTGAGEPPDDFRCELYITRYPDVKLAIGGLQALDRGMDQCTFGWFFLPDYRDMSYKDIYWWDYYGDKNVHYRFMRGACCCFDESDPNYLFVVEGDPEWRVQRCFIDRPPFIEPDASWGHKSDEDDGFYNPQDIVIDSKNNVYILDIKSNGDRVIKTFTLKGEPKGSFGDNILMESDPRRISVNWKNDWLYVVMKDQVSIFFPTERPY